MKIGVSGNIGGQSWSGWAISLLFFLLLLFGGAGTEYPLVGALEQTIALILVAVVLIFPGRASSAPKLSLAARVLIAIPLLFVALQLLPLPPSLWMKLPGRALASEILAATGQRPSWHSLSLAPVETVKAALELLPGIALVVAGCKAESSLRRHLVATFVLAALFSVLLGALQRVGGHGFQLYPDVVNSGVNAVGLFVNRNHQATMVLLAIPLAAYWVATSQQLEKAGPGLQQLLAWGIILLLAAGVIGTASRTGFVLLVLAVGSAWLLLNRRHPSLRLAAVTVLPLSLLVVVGSQLPTVQRTLARFSQDQELRPLFWSNTSRAASDYWPAGSGLGTFQLIYPTVEPRDQIRTFFVNSAHNDYVQIWLEGGVTGGAALIGVIGIIILGARQGFSSHQSSESRKAVVAALACLFIIALHSLVDYPLRMMSIMAAAGLVFALLLAARRTEWPPQRASAGARDGQDVSEGAGITASSGLTRYPAGLGLMLVLASVPLLFLIWSLGLSQQAIADREPDQALFYAWWTPDAIVAAGDAALERGQLQRVDHLADRALAISPLDAPALALKIEVADQQGRGAAAEQMLALGSKLGWREPEIQYKLAQRAAERENYAAALPHADALLRNGANTAVIKSFLRQVERVPEANQALAAILAENPPWRRSFLVSITDLEEEDVGAHADLLGALRDSGAPPQPEEINAFLSYLVRQDLFDEAVGYARHFGMRHASGVLLDANAALNFTGAGSTSDPFAWQAGKALGVIITAEAGGALHISSHSATAGNVMHRLIVAAPGVYTLSGRVRTVQPDALSSFNWSLRCRETGQLIVPVTRQFRTGKDGTISFEEQFLIPAGQCPAQNLDFAIDTSIGGRADITLLELSASGSEAS